MIRIENLHMHYRTERGEVYAVRDTATCCRGERLGSGDDVLREQRLARPRVGLLQEKEIIAPSQS